MKNTRAMKLAGLIKLNNRYAPLLDTGLKLGALLLPIGGVVGLCLWTMFNNYLGWLGQASLPLAQAGDWLFLLVFGAAVALYFGTIVLAPTALTSMFQWNVSGAATRRKISQACGASAVGALLSTIALLLWKDIAALISVIASTFLAALSGAFILTRYIRPYSTILAVCIHHAALSLAFLLWAIALLAFLSPSIGVLGKIWPAPAALGLSGSIFLLLILYIIKPAAGIFVGLVLSCFWIGEQASPQGGPIIPSALYTANLGGGRPAHHVQSTSITGEICNLGVEARPILVFEPVGCEQDKALARLRKLKGLGRLDRKSCLPIGKPRQRGISKTHPPPRAPQNNRICGLAFKISHIFSRTRSHAVAEPIRPTIAEVRDRQERPYFRFASVRGADDPPLWPTMFGSLSALSIPSCR